MLEISMRAPGRLATFALFAFVLASDLLFARREFQGFPPDQQRTASDGLVEYMVGRRWLETGHPDLPDGRLRDIGVRAQPGVDGRYYSVFGSGNSLLFMGTASLDAGWLGWAGEHERAAQITGDWPRPYFFSTSAHALSHAAAATLFFALLRALGLSASAALWGSLFFGFTSTNLLYARLSYNMPLANACVLGGLLCAVRSRASTGVGGIVLAGACLGAALLVRPAAVTLTLPIAYYLWCVRSDPLRATVALAAGVAPFLAALFAWNALRFGSPLASGYTDEVLATHFDARLSDSIPRLLLSPGRSLFAFSPLLVLGIAGWRRLVRARRAEGLLCLALLLVDFAFYAAIRNWSTPTAWGPRYHLFSVVMLSVPLAFWLDGVLQRGGRARQLVLLLFLAGFLFQIVPGLTEHARDTTVARGTWSLSGSQLALAWQALFELLRGAPDARLNLWWAGPDGARSGPMLALLSGVVTLWVLSLSVLVRPIWQADLPDAPAARADR